MQWTMGDAGWVEGRSVPFVVVRTERGQVVAVPILEGGRTGPEERFPIDDMNRFFTITWDDGRRIRHETFRTMRDADAFRASITGF